MRRLVDILINLLLSLILLLLVIVTIENSMNIKDTPIKIYIVSTGSMRPTLKPGDLIVVKKVSEKDIHVDDILTYKSSDLTITHRVVSLKDTGVVTKGDENNTDDGIIPYTSIIGKKILIIPKLGYIFEFITPKLLYIISSILFLCYLLFILMKVIKCQN